ncbi:MAG: 2Fe-2S iron-sulfur cluster-binding protein [Pseudomonadota bacterium]
MPPDPPFAMPKITIHREGQTQEGEVAADSNLVVLAGIRKFPYPHINYLCGMGKCSTCKSRILSGGERLGEPNWREQKTLGDDALNDGYRLLCQLRIFEDLEIEQEGPLRGPRKRV